MRAQAIKALGPLLLVLLSISHLPITAAQNTNFTQCCVKALLDQSLDSSYTCGASYSDGRPPAKPIHGSLRWCNEECGGFQLSRINHLSEWAGPLVGFLLPALVFSMSIPRDWKLPVPSFLFRKNLSECGSAHISFVYLCIALIITTIETLRWVMVVFVYAGPMLVGGLHEIFLDNRLLSKIGRDFESYNGMDIPRDTRKMLVTLLLGNLSYETAVDDVTRYILDAPVTEARAHLHSLLESQAAFGTVVGSPVVFYMGSFVYALLDVSKNLGDNDTSHSIALGLWYSIIVIVAIICGCLLGCNNPAALEGIVTDGLIGTKKRSTAVFYSRYEPAPIWKRGANTFKWANGFQLQDLQVDVENWIGYMGFFAAVLITVPCLLAAIVSYNTPEVGLGCRSFMFLMYWVSQMVLIAVFIVEQISHKPKRYQPKWSKLWAEFLNHQFKQVPSLLLWIVKRTPEGLALGLALISGIGGTIMQLTGVYRNCICKAGIKAFINRNANITLQFATDTQLDRDSAKKVWMPTGVLGLSLLAALCLFAWWYQENIRTNCSTYIHGKLPASSVPLNQLASGPYHPTTQPTQPIPLAHPQQPPQKSPIP